MPRLEIILENACALKDMIEYLLPVIQYEFLALVHYLIDILPMHATHLFIHSNDFHVSLWQIIFIDK